MKRFFTYLFLMCAVIINIYLIFYWQPIDNKGIEENKNTEVIAYSKSLYKMSKEKVLDKLEDKERKELETIIYKLSAYDIGKLKNYIEDSDEDKGLINTFKLLKKRVPGEDYNRIKEISAIFLDISELEKEL